MVQPFLLHPPLNKLYGGQEAKTERPRAHYALFTQKEAPVRLLPLTTWILSLCPGWGHMQSESSPLVLTVTQVKLMQPKCKPNNDACSRAFNRLTPPSAIFSPACSYQGVGWLGSISLAKLHSDDGHDGMLK